MAADLARELQLVSVALEEILSINSTADQRRAAHQVSCNISIKFLLFIWQKNLFSNQVSEIQSHACDVGPNFIFVSNCLGKA